MNKRILDNSVYYVFAYVVAKEKGLTFDSVLMVGSKVSNRITDYWCTFCNRWAIQQLCNLNRTVHAKTREQLVLCAMNVKMQRHVHKYLVVMCENQHMRVLSIRDDEETLQKWATVEQKEHIQIFYTRQESGAVQAINKEENDTKCNDKIII